VLGQRAGARVAGLRAQATGDPERLLEDADALASDGLVWMDKRRPVTDRLDHVQPVVVEDLAHALDRGIGRLERVVQVEPCEAARESQLADAAGVLLRELVDAGREDAA
jgi:hypothetical protein